MPLKPLCETTLTFELLSEDGYGTSVFITVVSSRSQRVVNEIKNEIASIKRFQEIQSELNEDSQVFDLVNEELSLEIKSSVARIVTWSGFEEEYSVENATLLCSTNPFVRRQVIYHSEKISDFLDESVEQLIEFAKRELKLSEKQKDGATLRETLESIKKQTGIVPPELETLKVRQSVMFLWEHFLHLNQTRSSGMGVSAISYSEIKAYCELNDVSFSPYELKVIKSLDGLFLEHYNKQSEKETQSNKK